MSTAAAASPAAREPDLAGQTVVVTGGSAGIGLEAARRARAEGAGVNLAGRDSARLQQAASELGALDTATPEDVAALAVHIMTNSALTGATFDVDGGEQVLGKE
jgi:NAD(P)-dependent dehydrogenase (short-subunit alcohol dehydrogenase family)